MRIISGKFRRKTIIVPNNLSVRPTTDFAKEGLFNILSNRIDFEKVKFLDLFSGTGNISYEMASRGCNNITCVDENYLCCTFIRKTAQNLKLENFRVYRNDAYRFCETIMEKYDLIFADPPFTDEKIVEIPEIVFQNKILSPGGTLILEHPANINFSNHRHFSEVRKYGKIRFSFFNNHER